MSKGSVWKPLEVELLEVGGFLPSMRAMKLPKQGQTDSYYLGGETVLGASDKVLATRLIKGGNDHAKAMRGIIAWVELKMQVGFMIEFETYRMGVECLSTSSAMHGELKELSGGELAEQKQKDLPAKVYTRGVHLSYQALRGIYKARRRHRHPDWRIFCKFIESLPYFVELIFPEFDQEKEVKLLN